MNTSRTLGKWALRTAVIATVTAAAGEAAAQGYEPPNSLSWPLRSRATGAPRTALGNTLGEYQSYNGEVPYLHTGLDIRGVEGDPVTITADGNIWLAANFDADSCETATNCRVYVKGTDNRYIYYYSHLRLRNAAEELTSQVRQQILNAVAGGTTGVVQPNTSVTRGQVLSGIADFPDDDSWAHLHFSIIDSTHNYDVVHPLTALDPNVTVPIIDDERPRFQAIPGDLSRHITYLRDGTNNEIVPTGACREVTGSLDIVAFAKDSFFTDAPPPEPVPNDIDSIAVYEANYRVRRVGTGPVAPVVWNRFLSAPLNCPGPPGTVCAPVDQNGFFAASILQPAGGLSVASAYTNVLFAAPRSCSGYSVATFAGCPGFTEPEAYAHVLTNAYGVNGAWTPTDGLYQVTVEAFDQAGNGRAVSEHVTVNNAGASPLPAYPDVYVRDNSVETGEIPSNVGGEPFWASPDILVYPTLTPGITAFSPPGESQVTAGNTYDVYVRVSNDHCTPVDAIQTKVFFADPSMLLDPADFLPITTAGVFVGGLDLAPQSKGLLGPFQWTPSAADAATSNGHKCLLAYIDAPTDPLGAHPEIVQEDNNVGQRNVQVGTDTAFSIRNPNGAASSVELEFSGDDFPAGNPAGVVEMTVQYHPALEAAWTAVPGTELTRNVATNQLVLRFHVGHARMPAATLPATTVLPASVRLELPPSVFGSFQVHFAERLNGTLRGGMSFDVSRFGVPE